MEIRPSIKSEGLNGRIGGDYQGGAGGDLLSQLSQRVSDALDKAGSGSAGQGPQGMNSVDNQQVKNYISGLAAQPLAGMTHNVIC
jgi:hypothetical protein